MHIISLLQDEWRELLEDTPKADKLFELLRQSEGEDGTYRLSVPQVRLVVFVACLSPPLLVRGLLPNSMLVQQLKSLFTCVCCAYGEVTPCACQLGCPGRTVQPLNPFLPVFAQGLVTRV